MKTTALLQREHDLSPFTDDKSLRWAIGSLKYDSKKGRLMATDGCICATVPLVGGKKDFRLDARAVKKATSNCKDEVAVLDGEYGLVIRSGPETRQVYHSAGAQDGKWPKQEQFGGTVPDDAVIVTFTSAILAKLCKYAIACGNDDIVMAIAPDTIAPIAFTTGAAAGLIQRRGREDAEELTRKNNRVRDAIREKVVAVFGKADR